MSVLQDLYDSEINVHIATFWDSGILVKLGDKLNGYRAGAVLRRWGEVEPWLIRNAIEHYPDTLFARMYRDGLSTWRTFDQDRPGKRESYDLGPDELAIDEPSFPEMADDITCRR